jgi:hypothetical protein
MTRRLVSAIFGAALLASLGAGAVLGGEVTGTGKSLTIEDGGKWGTFLHGRSECAFSGQEDLQYQDEQGNPLPEFTKGSPGHAQSWGQIPKEFRDVLTAEGFSPGMACNPMKAGSHP